jgi:hypothetical protein
MNILIGKYTFFLIFLSTILCVNAFSQEIKIETGPSEIAINETFNITISVINGRLKSYDQFPDIKGMVKRGTSSSSSTNIINGQYSSTQSITQSYMAQQEGMYELQPFSITVNGEIIKAPGKKIKVGPAKQYRSYFDPFEDEDPFFGLFGRKKKEPQEFIDLEEDAFLALSTDKDEVFTGEGVLATFAFYVSENNQAPLDFYDIGKQLTDILKKIRPEHCWEENFNIESITGNPVQINGKKYMQYKIYQAMFFPLNAQQIEFPSVGMKFIKYKVSKNPSFFGRSRQEDFKTFYTKAKTIRVKELPPHPLKDKVAVGRYRLEEKINTKSSQTGESLQYSWKITGEGNISAINEPTVNEGESFTIYPPDIKQNIRRGNNKITGTKGFEFYIIPNEPGQFDLKENFKWIYFNIATAKYDTLISDIKIDITGESKKNDHITSNDMGSFYEIINLEDNTLKSRTGNAWFKIFVNIFILFMLAATTLFLFKNKA